MTEALDQVLADIAKTHGKESISRLGDEETVDIEVIPTGSLTLDLALGVGGIPRGRIVEIFGPESAGKSTLAQTIAGMAQIDGQEAAYIDVEHAFDPGYASDLGIDTERLIISQPSSGEQALDIVEALVISGEIACVVIDSVAALVPQAEIDGSMGKAHVGLQSRLMSQALRKLTPLASATGTSVIFINQLRERIGVSFGNPEYTPGGKALKFYASVRIDLRSQARIKDGDKVIGRKTKARVIKNKVGQPFKEAFFDIMFTRPRGINTVGCLFDAAVDQEIIEKNGAWFLYEGEQIGHGRIKCIDVLREEVTLRNKIEIAMKDMYAMSTT